MQVLGKMSFSGRLGSSSEVLPAVNLSDNVTEYIFFVAPREGSMCRIARANAFEVMFGVRYWAHLS